MITRKIIIVIFAVMLIVSSCTKKMKELWIANAPAGNAMTTIQKDSCTVIPNGRFITPQGRQIEVAPHPYGLTLSPDGNIAITANSGVRPFSISIIRDIMGENPQVQQIPEGAATDEGILAAVFMGLAISPDNKIVYVAGGEHVQKLVGLDIVGEFESAQVLPFFIGAQDVHNDNIVDAACVQRRDNRRTDKTRSARYDNHLTLQ